MIIIIIILIITLITLITLIKNNNNNNNPYGQNLVSQAHSYGKHDSKNSFLYRTSFSNRGHDDKLKSACLGRLWRFGWFLSCAVKVRLRKRDGALARMGFRGPSAQLPRMSRSVC